MLKKILFGAAVIFITFTVFADDCGDSVCGMFMGEYTCVVVNDTGGLIVCTEAEPCVIKC